MRGVLVVTVGVVLAGTPVAAQEPAPWVGTGRLSVSVDYMPAFVVTMPAHWWTALEVPVTASVSWRYEPGP